MITKALSNSVVWVILILLIVINTLFSHNSTEMAIYYITIFSAIKFVLVSFQFMETKQAHPFWKVLVCVLAFVYSLLIVVLY